MEDEISKLKEELQRWKTAASRNLGRLAHAEVELARYKKGLREICQAYDNGGGFQLVEAINYHNKPWNE